MRVWRREGAAGVIRRLRSLRPTRQRGTAPSTVPLDDQYRRWRARVEPGHRALRELADVARSWSSPVSMVFLIQPAPGNPGAMQTTLASLRNQPYQRWRAVAVADPAQSGETPGDTRVSHVSAQPGVHWSDALMAAAHPARGEYVGILSAGAQVTRHGLLTVARALRRASDCDLAYTDWDQVDGRGLRCTPHFGYGWSPELLMACDYIGGLVLQRLDLLMASGGWRGDDAPAEVYAQLLRATGHARAPQHLAVVALSRPVGSDQGVSLADRQTALEAWLPGRHPGARVEAGRAPGITDVRFELEEPADVDIVIPTRDRVELLRRCLTSVDVSTHCRRVVIVDNGSAEPETLNYLAQQPHRVVQHPGDFNFSAIVNRGVKATDAPYVVLLNNDTMVRTPGWLEAMLEWCQRPGVGAVGARLLFADGRVQHEGIGIGIGRVAANLDLGWSAARATTAVTGACMMIRREAWEAIGGFDESLPVAFNDVDFCLRLWRAGWRVVMTPLAELQHDEGSSRGSGAPEADYRRFCLRWGEEDRLRDAFLGPQVAWPRPLTLRIPPRRSRARRS